MTKTKPPQGSGGVPDREVTTEPTAAALFLNAALNLARDGLPVLPLIPRGKRPRFHGSFKNATTDESIITAHWRRHRLDNVGVRPPRGVVVLDIDPRHGGDREMSRLVAENGPLPETWRTRTGSGGWHLWFRTGDIEVRSTLAPGIDLKTGRNGYVVAPPSTHPEGGQYVWHVWPGRRHRHPADAPEWLRAAVQPAPPPPRWTHTANGMNAHGEFTVHCLAARVSAAREGTRNRTLYGAVRDAWKQGDLDTYEPDLIAAAVSTGLTLPEVTAVIRSVRGGHR